MIFFMKQVCRNSFVARQTHVNGDCDRDNCLKTTEKLHRTKQRTIKRIRLYYDLEDKAVLILRLGSNSPDAVRMPVVLPVPLLAVDRKVDGITREIIDSGQEKMVLHYQNRTSVSIFITLNLGYFKLSFSMLTDSNQRYGGNTFGQAFDSWREFVSFECNFEQFFHECKIICLK